MKKIKILIQTLDGFVVYFNSISGQKKLFWEINISQKENPILEIRKELLSCHIGKKDIPSLIVKKELSSNETFYFVAVTLYIDEFMQQINFDDFAELTEFIHTKNLLKGTRGISHAVQKWQLKNKAIPEKNSHIVLQTNDDYYLLFRRSIHCSANPDKFSFFGINNFKESLNADRYLLENFEEKITFNFYPFLKEAISNIIIQNENIINRFHIIKPVFTMKQLMDIMGQDEFSPFVFLKKEEISNNNLFTREVSLYTETLA
ncbi:MAG: hypothetical protein LR005_02105 [Candidatus Pacebacteria bacterium]|nr:hypothetical protein [Candidatus Paceibacterota bacterium]